MTRSRVRRCGLKGLFGGPTTSENFSPAIGERLSHRVETPRRPGRTFPAIFGPGPRMCEWRITLIRAKGQAVVRIRALTADESIEPRSENLDRRGAPRGAGVNARKIL